MAGRKARPPEPELSLENCVGCWLINSGVDKGRYGWEFRPVDENGKYYIRADGKPFRMGGKRSTLEDAQASYYAAVQKLEELKTGGRPKCTSDQTVRAWADYCLKTLWPTEGRGGREMDNRRSSLGKHVLPTLGDKRLDQVTRSDVRDVLALMEANGSFWNTRRNARNYMSALYVSAMAEFPKIITENPADIDIGKQPTRTKTGEKIIARRFLTEKESAKLLEVAQGDPYWIGVYLALNLGLRRGEILALRWVHVNFETEWVSILDNVQRSVTTGRTTQDPKTAAGDRRIKLPKRVVAVLREWRRSQPIDQEYVMPSPLGAAPEPRKFSKAMEDFRSLAGLVGNRDEFGRPLPDATLHHLRDTFCSYMANAKKVPVKVLMTIMGHEQVSTTLDYYIDASSTEVAEAMSLLDG